MEHHDGKVAQLLALEQRRREALVARDFGALAELLGEELVYTHSTGVVQDKAAYLDYVAQPMAFLSIERAALKVRLLDGAALMTGCMTSVMSVPGQPAHVTVKSHVTQLWEARGEGWQLAAFQATRLPQPA